MSETVELDEILRTFDPETRAAFQELDADAGRGDRRATGATSTTRSATSAPFAEDAAELVDILNRQEPAVQRLVANTGVVFEALTERDGQLRELIENSNRVFATTARARPRAAGDVHRAADVRARVARDASTRLDRVRARHGPAGRRSCARRRASSSPTLSDLAALAPDLEAFFRELDPLIDASKAGFPAAERMLEDLRPLLGQVDPALRQLNPILDFLGLYKRELTAFFANTVAATQATTVSADGAAALPAHDEPVQPGEPRRVSAPAAARTGRTRTRCRARFDKLRDGPAVLRDAPLRPRPLPTLANTPHADRAADRCPSCRCRCPCRRAVPDARTSSTASSRYPTQLFADILRFAFPAGQRPQPAPRRRARSRRRSTVQGETSQYPHVKPARQ